MRLKKTTVLLGAALSGICLLAGCASKNERAAKEAVEQELEKLQSSDSQMIQNTIDAQELLPSSQYTKETAEEIGEIFSLFYKDFSFKVKKVTVDEEKGTGKAKTELTTIDARSLAKDYSLSLLEKQIELDASPQEVAFSLEDSCLLLKDLLEKGDYGTESKEAEIPLEQTEDTWKVLHTSELDSQLTGNFSSYMTDCRFLTPSEIVDTHFRTIKGFDEEQIRIYLSLDQLVNTGDSYNSELAMAIAKQISNVFDYKIIDESQEDGSAKVQVSITSPDFESILASYKDQLTQWLETSESLSAGAQGRRDKERELLLSCIEKNEAASSRKVSITLYNDGINWKIQMHSDIAEAVFGDIPGAIASISQDIQ